MTTIMLFIGLFWNFHWKFDLNTFVLGYICFYVFVLARFTFKIWEICSWIRHLENIGNRRGIEFFCITFWQSIDWVFSWISRDGRVWPDIRLFVTYLTLNRGIYKMKHVLFIKSCTCCSFCVISEVFIITVYRHVFDLFNSCFTLLNESLRTNRKQVCIQHFRYSVVWYFHSWIFAVGSTTNRWDKLGSLLWPILYYFKIRGDDLCLFLILPEAVHFFL